jgi:hypothetical protein
MTNLHHSHISINTQKKITIHISIKDNKVFNFNFYFLIEKQETTKAHLKLNPKELL